MPSKTTQTTRSARYIARMRKEGRRPVTVFITPAARKRLTAISKTAAYANLHDAVSAAILSMEV